MRTVVDSRWIRNSIVLPAVFHLLALSNAEAIYSKPHEVIYAEERSPSYSAFESPQRDSPDRDDEDVRQDDRREDEAPSSASDEAAGNFSGDRVAIPEIFSSTIKSVTLEIQLPPAHKILLAANPFIKLFTPDGTFVKTYPITARQLSFLVDQNFRSERLLAELKLFYYREDRADVSLVKDVIFELKLDPSLPADNVKLIYTISQPEDGI